MMLPKPTPPIRDPKHLRNVASLSSCVSGARPCQAHHLQIKAERGVGQKAGDNWAVPLTHDEHMGGDGVHSVGSRLELTWFYSCGVDPIGLALDLWAARGDAAAMQRAVDAHRFAFDANEQKAATP